MGSYYLLNDPAVQAIMVTCGGKTYTVQTGQYPDGICPFYLENASYRSIQGDISGKAFDASGNVLYTLQENTWIRSGS